MKRILLILLMASTFGCLAQQPNTTNTVFNNGFEASKFLNIPTVASPATLGLKFGALNGFTSVGKIAYWDGRTFRYILSEDNAVLSYSSIFYNKRKAYVDTLGNDLSAVVGRIDKPFRTIQAAINSLNRTGDIYIGLGTFAAPDTIKNAVNLNIFGSGRPKTNTQPKWIGIDLQPSWVAPSYLVGGTIIEGPLFIQSSTCSNLEFKDFGVDVGSRWVSNKNAGNTTEGFFVFQDYYLGGGGSSLDGQHPLQSEKPPMSGLKVDNISSLGASPFTPDHAFLFENVINPVISNIESYYHTHGIVFKSIGGFATNLKAYGSGSEGFIAKSDDYANCYGLKVNNLYISSIGRLDGGGINIYGFDGTTAHDITINNFEVAYTPFGVYNLDLPIDNIHLVNGKFYGIEHASVRYGLNIGRFTLSNIDIQNSGTTPDYAVNINQGQGVLNNVRIKGNAGFYLNSDKRIEILNLRSTFATNNVIGSNVWGNELQVDSGARVLGNLQYKIEGNLISHSTNTNAPFQSQKNTSSIWNFGQRAGAGSTDDTFGFYSSIYGLDHNSSPVMQINPSGTVSVASGPVNPDDIVRLADLNAALSNSGTGGGVYSVSATVPTGLTVAGSPITTSGTLAFGLQSGYSIPSLSDQNYWNLKQDQLNGTGYVKVMGSTVTYDTTSYYPNSNPRNYITQAIADSKYPLITNNYVNPSWIDSIAYSKISDTPVIPTDNSQLANGAGYITSIDTTQFRTVANSLTKAQVQSGLNTKEPVVSSGTTSQYYRGDKSFQTLNTSIVPEGINLYYTDQRVADNSIVIGKQNQLNGTGFVKSSGSTISYDNSTYYPSSNPNGYTSNIGTVTNFSKTDGFGVLSTITNPTTTPNYSLIIDSTALRTVSNSFTKAQTQNLVSSRAILNQTTAQASSNFNISGNGTLGSMTVVADGTATGLINFLFRSTADPLNTATSSLMISPVTGNSRVYLGTSTNKVTLNLSNTTTVETLVAASPSFTGTPLSTTAAANTSTTQIATTAFVTTANNLKANIASPALTGVPTAPNAAAGTNNTQIATTAFVQSMIPQYVAIPAGTTSVSLAGGMTYGLHATTLTTCTLPATNPAEGTLITIIGVGAGQFKISQNANQYITSGNATTTVGTGGYVQTTTNNSTITIRYMDTNKWQISSANSAPTIN